MCGPLLFPSVPSCCRLTRQPTRAAPQGWGHLPAPLLGDIFRRLLDQQYNVEDVVRTWQVSVVPVVLVLSA